MPRPGWWWRGLTDATGQSTSEYLVLTGMVTVLILATVGLFVAPTALGFVRLARRMVVYLGS